MTTLIPFYNAPPTLPGGSFPEWLLLLVARLGAGAIFFLSGRAKVEGWFTITDGAFDLFASDYALPLVLPHLAAYAATISEHLFSMLLFLGLFTRLGAIGLLGMTLVIEVFVYPDAWPTISAGPACSCRCSPRAEEACPLITYCGAGCLSRSGKTTISQSRADDPLSYRRFQ
jgi:putative oxidoreductase